jgi:signal transduction histidine kinase
MSPLGRVGIAFVVVALCVALLTRWSDARRAEERDLEVVRVLMHAGLGDDLARLGAAPRYERPERLAELPSEWAAQASVHPTTDLPASLKRPVVLDGRALWLDDGTLWAQLGDGQLLRIVGVTGEPVPRSSPPLWLAAAAGAIGVAAWGASYVTRLRAIARASDAVALGHLEVRVGDASGDTLGALARQFDALAETLHRHRKQRDSFFRAVTHEMGTPLTRIAFALDLAESARDPEELTERIEAAKRQLEQLVLLSTELLDFAFESPDRPDARSRIAVAPALERLCADNASPDVGVELLWDADLPTHVLVDERAFLRAIDNLLRNAARYARERVTVSGAVREGQLEVWVEDDGPGIPEEARTSVFEPFARLDPSRNVALGGAGLGLAIVRRVVERHAGSAGVTRSPRLGGAAFVTRWPLSSTPA